MGRPIFFWRKSTCQKHNRRFTRVPAHPQDYHRPTPRAAELNDVFHLETGRVIGNDWVVRHENRYFQVKAQSRLYAPAKAKVMVCEWENGKLEIRYRGRAVAWDQIPAAIPARGVKPVQAAPRRNKTVTPKADHPWRHNYRKMALAGTTGMPVADAIRVAVSSTSP